VESDNREAAPHRKSMLVRIVLAAGDATSPALPDAVRRHPRGQPRWDHAVGEFPRVWIVSELKLRRATLADAELAAEEPLPKPNPDDERATSWKVPGPGGHVRHYVVAAAIADALSGDHNGQGGLPGQVDDAAALKRCWMSGFLGRCCEEAVPPASPLSAH